MHLGTFDSSVFYTSKPVGAERGIQARALANDASLKKYLSAIELYEVGSGEALDDARKALEALKPSDRLDSALLAKFDLTLAAFRERDAEAAKSHLDWISQGDRRITSDSPTIDFSISNDAQRFFASSMMSDGISIDPPNSEDEGMYRKTIDEAFELFKLASPEMYAESMQVVHSFTFINVRGKFLSGSMSQTLGTVFIGLPYKEKPPKWSPLIYFVEHIVHECSHVLLNALMVADPICLNPQDTAESPIRRVQRPIDKVFHATYVICRMMHVFKKLVDLGHLEFQSIYDHFIPLLEFGMSELNKHARLTPAGQIIMDTMAETAGVQ